MDMGDEKIGYVVGVRLDSGHLNVEFNARPGLTDDEAFDLAITTIEHELNYAKLDYVE
jgi:hypothetical protein